MAPHSARALALHALAEWRAGREFADAILQRLLHESVLAASDRGFANELFYGVIRNLTLLDFWIDQLRSGKLDCPTRDLLRLGLYQIAFLQTPAHAAVYETVELAPQRSRGLINGALRSATRRLAELQDDAAKQPLHVRFSHPAFLVAKWRAQFGDVNTTALLKWNNQPAPVFVRINELRTAPDEFLRANQGATLLPHDPRFAIVPHVHAPIDAGMCYAQDPSTVLAPDLLAPKPDEYVLDACAAPGGKTSYLAQLMANHGTIVACDRVPERLELLRANLRRLGVANTRVVQHDWKNERSPTALENQRFDRILVDVPCSNTGVMRRRVDVRWRLRSADFARMPNEQFGIVRQVVKFLRPGGALVYSTCSIEREENDDVVERALAVFPFLRLQEKRSALPFCDHTDGAFAALLVHTG